MGVFPADDDGIHHARIGQQDTFDLGRVDVLAAGLDHVFDPIDEIDGAVRVAPADIAQMEPAAAEVMRVGVGRVPVAAEQSRAAKRDLSRFAIRDIVAVGVHQPKMTAGTRNFRQSTRHHARRDPPGGERRQPGFRRPERIGIRGPQQRRNLRDLMWGHQIRHRAGQLDAGGHDRASAQRLDHVGDHAGHKQQPPLRHGLDRMDDAVHVIARHHDDLAAHAQHADRLFRRGHVVHRRPGNEIIPGRQLEIDAAGEHPRDLGAVADQRPFRHPGGAAGVKDHQPVFGLDQAAWLGGGRAGQPVLIVVTDGDDRSGVDVQALHGGAVGGGEQDGARRDQVDAMTQFRVRQAPVQRGHDRADLAGGKQQFQVFQPVFRQDRHPVAALDPQSQQDMRQPVDPCIERPEGQVPRPVLDRRMIGAQPNLMQQQTAHRQAGGLPGQSLVQPGSPGPLDPHLTPRGTWSAPSTRRRGAAACRRRCWSRDRSRSLPDR